MIFCHSISKEKEKNKGKLLVGKIEKEENKTCANFGSITQGVFLSFIVQPPRSHFSLLGKRPAVGLFLVLPCDGVA
jgi:hypothetical protein